MNVSYISLALLLLATALASGAQSIHQSRYARCAGRLEGLILDSGNARVSAAKVIIEGKNLKREVLSADDGSYSVDLPEGKYKVRVERGGFYPSSKKTVSVTWIAATKLNVRLKGIRNEDSHP